jgi:hypothetical protein
MGGDTRNIRSVKRKKLLALPRLIKEYETEITCDLAEYYGVHDYRKISPRILMMLISGLREDSRLVMKATGRDYNIAQLMQAFTVDRLSVLCWQKTKDGAKGKNKPKMLSDTMLKVKEETDIQAFNSADEFERHRREIIERLRHE